jgi:hypothetical protein
VADSHHDNTLISDLVVHNALGRNLPLAKEGPRHALGNTQGQLTTCPSGQPQQRQAQFASPKTQGSEKRQGVREEPTTESSSS